MRVARMLLATFLLTLVAGAAVAPQPAQAASRPFELVLALNQPLGPPHSLFNPNPIRLVLDNALLVSSYLDRGNYILVRTVNSNVTTVLNLLRPLAGVRFAEPNFIYNQAQALNDPLLEQQSYLADAEASPAWAVSAGMGVNIAVLDTGVDVGHPDLAAAIAKNGNESYNGRDDDGNGAVDDVAGWNVIQRSGDGNDDGGHGTEVAGAAAARAGNGVGIAGIAFQAGVIPVKVLGGDGSGVATDVADGIRYAVARGARVINLSLIGPDRAEVIDEAVAHAERNNAIVVVAGGNQSSNLDATPLYPASYPRQNVIAVGAVDESGLASFSNRGSAVDLAAPGVAITTTTRGGSFGQTDGTSIASPLVAGALAIISAHRPELGAGDVIGALLAGASARPVSGVATGRLSVARSLGMTPEQIQRALAGQPFVDGGNGGFDTGSGTADGSASSQSRGLSLRLRTVRRARSVRGKRRVKIVWSATGDTVSVRSFSIAIDGRRVRVVSGRRRGIVLVTRSGRHRVTVTARDARGRRLASAGRRFRVLR